MSPLGGNATTLEYIFRDVYNTDVWHRRDDKLYSINLYTCTFEKWFLPQLRDWLEVTIDLQTEEPQTHVPDKADIADIVLTGWNYLINQPPEPDLFHDTSRLLWDEKWLLESDNGSVWFEILDASG